MDNFGKLLPKFQAIDLADPDLLLMCIDAIFTKAIDEPRYQTLYTILCVELANSQRLRVVQSLPDGQSPPPELDFRRAMLARCQLAFEQRQRPPRLPSESSTM